MSTGKVTYDGDTGHSLELSMAHDFNVFWDNKQYVFDLIRSCWDVPEDIFSIQKQFVYDPDKEYPYELESSVDFESGEQGNIRYNVCNSRSEENRYNMWAIKRQGLDKNTMVRL